MTTQLTIPGWLKITSSKEFQITSVKVAGETFRPGQIVATEVGLPVYVWTKKHGMLNAVVSESGIVVQGLNSDGSKAL